MTHGGKREKRNKQTNKTMLQYRTPNPPYLSDTVAKKTANIVENFVHFYTFVNITKETDFE